MSRSVKGCLPCKRRLYRVQTCAALCVFTRTYDHFSLAAVLLSTLCLTDYSDWSHVECSVTGGLFAIRFQALSLTEAVIRESKESSVSLTYVAKSCLLCLCSFQSTARCQIVYMCTVPASTRG